jgi:putative addiction module antidote
MYEFKLTTVGSSEGFIVPKEVRERMGIKKGDRLFLTEAEDGSFRLTPYDPTFEQQIKLAEQIMHDDRDLLRALAK